MIRDIVTAPHPILRETARPVKRFTRPLQTLIDDMFETMYAAKGMGLAAPQIGRPLQVIVVQYEDTRLALVNPRITKKSMTEIMATEGCLSLPGLIGFNVPRRQSIHVMARLADGSFTTVVADGMLARVIQHEVDHLRGVLFPDLLLNPLDLRKIA